MLLIGPLAVFAKHPFRPDHRPTYSRQYWSPARAARLNPRQEQ